MTEILMPIQKDHVDNIINGRKISVLRLRAPVEGPPYKVIVYESKAGGGCGKVVLEFVCYMQQLHHHQTSEIMKRACVSFYFVAPFTEMFIGDLVVYDTPRELSVYGVKRAPMSWQYLRRKTDAN